NDHIHHDAVDYVRKKKSDAGAIQSEETYTNPGATQVDQSPCKLAPKKDVLRSLCEHDEAHRPAYDAKRHSQAEPTEKFDGRMEFRSVEHSNDEGCESQCSDDAWPCQEKADLGLLIHSAVAFIIVFANSHQPRIEIRSHGLKNESDVDPAE